MSFTDTYLSSPTRHPRAAGQGDRWRPTSGARVPGGSRDRSHNPFLNEEDYTENNASRPEESAATPGAEEYIENLLLRVLARQSPAVPHHLPEFHAAAHEDVDQFLHICTQELSETRRPVDVWTKEIGDRLREDAARWFQPFKTLDLSFAEFSASLRRYCTHPRRIESFRADLFAERQASHENTEAFLRRKAKTASVVAPDVDEGVLVKLLVPLCQERARTFLYNARPRSVEEVLYLAAEYELDHPRPAPNVARGERAERNASLPPCRYCPERHFHKDCPVLIQRYPRPENYERAPRPGAQ